MKRNRGRQKGYKLSKKSKDKIGNSRRGQKHTCEARIKIAMSLTDYHDTKPIEKIVERHLKWLKVSFARRINNRNKGPFSPTAVSSVRRDALNRLKFLSSDGVIAYLTLEQRVFIVDDVLMAFDRSYLILSWKSVGYQAELDNVREALTKPRRKKK